MKKTNQILNRILEKVLFFVLLATTTVAMSASVFAACNEERLRNFQQSIVTYYETEYPDILGFDSRCRYIANESGPRVCRIRLRGVLYRPNQCAYQTPANQPPATFPALVINHGSEHLFPAEWKFRGLAAYLVPKGYIVFVPFRRGHGDEESLEKRSTGVYIDDMLDDWQNGTRNYIHNTSCNNRSCYKAQLLREQADEEVADSAMDWLKARNDVKTDPGQPQDHRIAIMGSSYGGAVTVFANRNSFGQKASVAFSPGAQQWDRSTDCLPGDPNCGTDFQRMIISAAGGANKPAYYLQARWDYDTRATIDLAYAHAYRSPDSQHSRGWNAAIFPYIDPCKVNSDGERECTPEDFQSIHAGFFSDAEKWGPTILEFLQRYDVK